MESIAGDLTTMPRTPLLPDEREGVLGDLVNKYGPIATLFASQQQLQEIRAHAAHACLSHPGRWLETRQCSYGGA